ncbi:hypothetical protein ACFQFG_17195 [Methylobacterium persicinum]
MLDAIGEIYPHRVVLDDGRRRLSPFLLGLMVRRLARAILDLAPAGPVAVGLREGGMGIVATLAALAAGRDCVIVDPGRLPEAAQGCACLVRVPRDGGRCPRDASPSTSSSVADSPMPSPARTCPTRPRPRPSSGSEIRRGRACP